MKLWIGSTVRAAAQTDGGGKENKQMRYLASFVVETFGRLGKEAEVVQAELAAAVRRRNLSRGVPAGCPLRRWRARRGRERVQLEWLTICL